MQFYKFLVSESGVCVYGVLSSQMTKIEFGRCERITRTWKMKNFLNKKNSWHELKFY